MVGRACARVGAAALLTCSVMVPSAHAVGSKCGVPVEERVYELVSIEAVDGQEVPESVRERWAGGVEVTARVDGMTLRVAAIDAAVTMEVER